MADPFKNLQAAARRRGLSLRKVKIGDDHGRPVDGFAMGDSRRWPDRPMTFFEVTEVCDELRARPIEA